MKSLNDGVEKKTEINFSFKIRRENKPEKKNRKIGRCPEKLGTRNNIFKKHHRNLKKKKLTHIYCSKTLARILKLLRV